MAEIQRLKDEENRKALQLSENERLILTQKARLQESQIQAEEQQKRFLAYMLGVGLIFVIGLAIVLFRINKSRKLIEKQNEDLARQQKVIRKANVELNKAHETMRRRFGQRAENKGQTGRCQP